VSGDALFVRSLGQVTCAGTGIGALLDRLSDAAWYPELRLDRPDAPSLAVATCREFTTQGHLPPLVARRLDRPARLLAVAAREALVPFAGSLPWPRDRIGVAAATGNAGTEALFQVLQTVFLAGPEEASPMQFPSTVANAAASQLGILEKLSGPNITFAEKQVGGLRALTEAGRLLRHRRADAVLAVAVDEAHWLNAEGYDRLRATRRAGRPGFVLGEGAVVLLVSGEPGPSLLARLAGWGSCSSAATTYRYPADAVAIVRACESALQTAGIAAGDVDLVVSMANGAPALAKLEQDALERLFTGRRPAALTVSDRLGEGSFASLARVAVAVLAVSGLVIPRWGAPDHLSAAGFAALDGRPGTALVAGVAAGGSAIAAVVTAP
jgi:3-oxoacyl-[acyl-carrier-protein] synthase II